MRGPSASPPWATCARTPRRDRRDRERPAADREHVGGDRGGGDGARHGGLGARDSRLLGGTISSASWTSRHLLAYAFPGLSGFKYQRRPPHRVKAAPACRTARRKSGSGSWGGAGTGPRRSRLEHCRACSQALIAALEDLKFPVPKRSKGFSSPCRAVHSLLLTLLALGLRVRVSSARAPLDAGGRRARLARFSA